MSLFFFKNSYFVRSVFRMEKKGSQMKNGNFSKKKEFQKRAKFLKKKTHFTFFERYQGYIKKYNFKNNLLSLFGFAHFCSLNFSLYKDAIKAYEYLKEQFPNNFYVTCELAKLYYHYGRTRKSMKCFNKMNRIYNRNRVLKKYMIHRCCIRYLERRQRRKEKCNDHIFPCVQVINAKRCRHMQIIILPEFFSNRFIYVELLVNMLVCKKDNSALFILLHDYENALRNLVDGRDRQNEDRRIKYDSNFYYMIGKYFSFCRMRKRSISCFKKGIQKDRKHLYSYMALAQEYFSCGNMNSCVFILEKVISLYFNNPSAWFSLAKCLEYMKNYRFSIFCYEQAINLEENTIFYYHLSDIYLKMGEVNTCIETLKKGWEFKKGVLFSSELFYIYLSIFKAQNGDLSFMGKVQEGNTTSYIEKNMNKNNFLTFYGKNNECLKWCVKYLKCCLNRMKIMRTLNKEEGFSFIRKMQVEEKRKCCHFDETRFSSNENHGDCEEYINNFFFKNFKMICGKNTSYFCFINFLRNSSTILFEAIYFLANYFFFNKKFYNSLKLFEILWDAGWMYSEDSFRMYRYAKSVLHKLKDDACDFSK